MDFLKKGGRVFDYFRICNVCSGDSGICSVWDKPVFFTKAISETAGKIVEGIEIEISEDYR